jgi:hypothetical protein
LLVPEVNFPTYYAPSGVTWSMRVSDGGPPNDTFQWGYNLSNRLYVPQNPSEPQMFWGFESHYPNSAADRPHTSEMYLRWFAPGAPYGSGFVEPFGAYVDRTTKRIFNVHLDSDRLQFSAGDSDPTHPYVVWTPTLLDFRAGARFDRSVQVNGNINITGQGTLVKQTDTSGYLAAISRRGSNYGLFWDADAANPSLQLWANNAARLKIDSAGNISLSSVRGTIARTDSVPLFIDPAGQLGTISSSRELKDDIEAIGTGSARVMDLRPVTFRYKQPFQDGSKPVQYGLIAEEVAETFPELAAKNAAGKVETVKYHLLPVLLLNEMQRQEKMITRQQDEIRDLRKQIENLARRLQDNP